MIPTDPPPEDGPPVRHRTSTRSPRRRTILSVRAALILILGVGLLLGWIQAARRQHEAVLAIMTRDGYTITYDDGTPLAYQGSGMGFSPSPPGPAAADLGRDFFRTVVGVRLGGDRPYGPPLARAGVVATLLQLPHLRTIDLNVLPGLSDAEAAQLAGFGTLHEFSCTFGSDLTDAGLRALGRLANLKRLRVWGDFSDDGVVALRGLDRLEALALLTTSSRLQGPPPSRLLGRGLAHLASLPNLRTLEVESGRLDAAGLEALGRFRELRGLKLVGGTYGDADLRSLARLTRLQNLSVEDAPIDGSGFDALGRLDELVDVEVRSPRLTDAIIPLLIRLPNLRSVTLGGQGVTTAAAEGLRAAPRLTKLVLPRLSPVDRERLRRALPNCQVSGASN